MRNSKFKTLNPRQYQNSKLKEKVMSDEVISEGKESIETLVVAGSPVEHQRFPLFDGGRNP